MSTDEPSPPPTIPLPDQVPTGLPPPIITPENSPNSPNPGARASQVVPRVGEGDDGEPPKLGSTGEGQSANVGGLRESLEDKKTDEDKPTTMSGKSSVLASGVAKASNGNSKDTPAGSSSPAEPKRKKKRGPLASLFLACVPCVSSTAHDDRPTARPVSAAPPTSKPSYPSPSPSPAPKTSTAVPVTTDAASKEKEPTTELPATQTEDDGGAEEDNEKEDISEEQKEDRELAAATLAANTSPEGVTLSSEDTEGVTSAAVMPPGKETPRKSRRRSGKAPAAATEGIITSVPEPGALAAGIQQMDLEDSEEGEDEEESDLDDEEQNLIARGGVGIPIGEDGLPHPLLGDLSPDMKGKKCLVLDLDETLVHSSFKQMVHQADYVVPVEIENQYHNVYVIKRPGVDAFLKAMGDVYEVVVFTASLSKYADPVLDQLDVSRVVKHRLFRESCYNNKGSYVKDLSQLGRPIADCIIIDNSPASYVFHPNNAVPISSWFNDPHDTELTDLIPFLLDLDKVSDVRAVLDAGLYQQLAIA